MIAWEDDTSAAKGQKQGLNEGLEASGIVTVHYAGV